MTDGVTDRIRGFLQADDQRLNDEIRSAAAKYAEACRAANDRLRRCMDLLRQGLRTEAVHLAETDPPVTDLVGELDLAELQLAWDELCSLYDLPRAEPLRLELAEAIQEAYAELEPLSALLARHRRLALARAPLTMRIETLRELTAADEQSPFWEDDLRAYERARLREIESEARLAAQARNADRLQALVAEVTSPEWRERPSPDVQRRIKGFAGQVQRGSGRDELERIEPELQSAFSALDVAAGRRLRTAWDDAARRAKVATDDPLAERVAPVLGWLADEDAREEQDRAFATAVADLEAAVERDGTELAELERKAHAAARFDRELPGPLVIAYRNRRAGLETGEKRRRFAIAGGAVAALLLVVAFVGTVVWRAGIDQKADQLAREIATLVEAGKLAEARRLFDENRDLSSKEGWLAARRSLEDAERDESQRKAALTAAVEAAGSADLYVRAAPHLKVARERAATADEKLQVARLERDWQERWNSEFEANESGFRAAAAAAAEVLTRLDRGLESGDVAALRATAGQAESAVASLLPLTEGVRPEVAREREVLAARLAALRSAVDERADRERLFAGMTSALAPGGEPVQSIDRYVAAVEAYRQRFPKDPRSAELGEAVAESDLWRAAIRWRELADGWPTFRPNGADAEARLSAVEAYLAAHPSGPASAAATRYAVFLRSVASRTGEDGVNTRLTELFRAPLIGGPLHVVRTRGEKAYYLTAPADFQDGLAAPFTYVIGPDPSRDTKSTLLKKSELTSLKSKPAAQVELAETAVRDLSRSTAAAWDGLLLDVAKKVQSTEGIDPFVRHLLLTEVLTAAGDGNIFLAGSLEEVRSRLQDDQIDPAARWMDPDNVEAATVRQRSAAAVRRVTAGDLDAAWRSAAEQEQALEVEILQSRRAVGWLSKEGSQWSCHLAREVNGLVAASVVASDAGAAAWHSVGRVAQGIGSLQGPALKQGRVVFATFDAKSERSAGLGSRVGTNP